MSIRTVVLSSTRIYREGIAAQIDDRDGVQVTQTFDDCRGIEQRLRALRPDVVIADIAMAGVLHLLAEIKRARTSTRVIALTFSGEPERIYACARLGVEGFVSSSDSIQDLRACIVAVTRGEYRYPSGVARTLARRMSGDCVQPEANPLSVLTSRQSSVLQLLELGQTNKEIARTLGIEVATVKNHVHDILERLQVSNRCEAAALMRRNPPYCPDT